MIREGDEAAAQEDERVGKEPEVERKRDAEPEFGKHAAYKEREIQKQEEVKWAGEAERKRVEE
ncbi:unnamed protein product [Brassica rapa]|uniref:Uncharacterized protein n=3 Tax=Brassica TaxID=3705 RepID=A0A8D9HPQ7_BRACM|nr:unnamed protein product [Brassica napus]CAG7900646.1 unnamed protein product [Brassica rapa]CAG7903299.1 unnamed protein product [Brassica rapa]